MDLPPMPGLAQTTVQPVPHLMPGLAQTTLLPVLSLMPGLAQTTVLPFPSSMPAPHPKFEAPGIFACPPLPKPGFRYFYHYTGERAKNSILASGCIEPSLQCNGDAVYGYGVYGTELCPLAGRPWLAANNWQDPKILEKLTWAFRVTLPNENVGVVMDPNNIFRSILLYRGRLRLQDFEWKFGQVF